MRRLRLGDRGRVGCAHRFLIVTITKFAKNTKEIEPQMNADGRR